MVHELPELGYEFDALEPHIDKETMERHYSKNHKGYVDKLNTALESHADLQDKDVEELLADLDSLPEEIKTAVQNSGGGHANHSFWWPLLKKDVEISGEIEEAINEKFGGFDKFKEEFTNTAMGLFGSGWVWLVVSEGELEIMTTPNQESPISQGKTPILSVDMWEHAFVRQFGADKAKYLEAFFNVINWDKVNENFKEAKT